MKVGLTGAVRWTGRSKSTIHRDTQSGKLSVTVDEHGFKEYDLSELERFYGKLRTAKEVAGLSRVSAANASVFEGSGTGMSPLRRTESSRLEMELEFAAKELAMEKARVAELREDRDRWRGVAENALRCLPAPVDAAGRIGEIALTAKPRFFGLFGPRRLKPVTPL